MNAGEFLSAKVEEKANSLYADARQKAKEQVRKILNEVYGDYPPFDSAASVMVEQLLEIVKAGSVTNIPDSRIQKYFYQAAFRSLFGEEKIL